MLNKIIVTLIIGVLCLTTFNTGVYASTTPNTIYVDINGNDQWDGTSPIHINGTNKGPKKDIFKALSSVPDNGTLKLNRGTYSYSGKTLNIKKNITIEGSSNAKLSININNTISNIESQRVTIKNMAISGDIVNSNADLTLEKCDFSGKIKNEYEHLSLKACKISDYSSIHSEYGYVTLKDIIVSGHHVDLLKSTGDVTLSNCTFKGSYKSYTYETQTSYSGIDLIDCENILTVDNCTFDNNEGCCISAEILNLKNSKFINNTNTPFSGYYCYEAPIIYVRGEENYHDLGMNIFEGNKPKDIYFSRN